MHRFARKLDANHLEIKQSLERRGWHICDLSAAGKYPDLLAWKRDVIGWVECKVPGSRSRYTFAQLEYIALTPMPVLIATSGDDALDKLKRGDFITPDQKNRLAAMLYLNGKKLYTPSQVMQAMNR